MGHAAQWGSAFLGVLLATAVSGCGGSAKDGEGQGAGHTVDGGNTDDGGPGTVGDAASGGNSGGLNGTVAFPAPSTGEVTGQDPTTIAGAAYHPLDDMDHAGENALQLPDGIPGFLWSSGIGNWYQTLPDDDVSDAIVDPFDPPRGDSTKACHLQSPASPAHLWAQLNHPFGTPVDVSRYSALAFWTRSDSGDVAFTVTLSPEGWITSASELSASPHSTLTAGAGWQQWVIAFDDIGLNGMATASIVFTPEGDGGSIDFWVDDLALLCREAC